GAAAELCERALVGTGGRARDGGVEFRIRPVARCRGVNRAHRGLAEGGLDEPGLDHDHVDAEAADLEAKRVADRLDRVLGRVVEAAAREREAPSHRADVDDLAPALAAHAWQHELRKAHEPEYVRVELAAHLVERYFLDRPALAVAGVVHENADGALGP